MCRKCASVSFQTLIVYRFNSFNLTRSTISYFKLYHLSFKVRACVCVCINCDGLLFLAHFIVVDLFHVHERLRHEVHGHILCTMEKYSMVWYGI